MPHTAKNSEIPTSLTAEHASIYRDAVSASFAFDAGLVASVSASANHKGNFDFHETFNITGCGSAIALNTPLDLDNCNYVNLTETDEYRIEQDPIIDPPLVQTMRHIYENNRIPNQEPSPDVQTLHQDDQVPMIDLIGNLTLNIPHDEVASMFGHGTLPCPNEKLGTLTLTPDLANLRIYDFDETPDTQTPLTDRPQPSNTQVDAADAPELTRLQLMLLDFINTTPPDAATDHHVSSTLRSCLPAIWTLDAINRSITQKQRIDRSETHNINLKNAIPEMSASNWEDYPKLALDYARKGHLDAAINTSILGIMQKDDRIRKGWFTPRLRSSQTSPRHDSYDINSQAFYNQHGFSTIAPARTGLGATQKMDDLLFDENPNN